MDAETYLKLGLPPVGYESIDELAAQLGVPPEQTRRHDIVIQGRSMLYYSVVRLISAVVALCKEVSQLPLAKAGSLSLPLRHDDSGARPLAR